MPLQLDSLVNSVCYTMAAQVWAYCVCHLDAVCVRRGDARASKIDECLLKNKCLESDEILCLCLSKLDVTGLDAVQKAALNRVQAKLERTTNEAEAPPMPTTAQSSNDELAKLLQNAVDGKGKKHERVNVDIGSGLSGDGGGVVA